MSRRRKSPQRCTANCADGSRCGKWCAEGQVVCAKHDPNAKALGIIAQQESDDPLVALKRLTKHSDPAIRLRAVNAYLDRLEKDGCQVCAARKTSMTDNDTLVHYASPSQREELLFLVKAIRTIKAAVQDYIARGGQPHVEVQEKTDAAVIKAPAPVAAAPRAAAVESAAPTADPDDEQVMVWREGALHPEPRAARDWKEL